MVAANFISTLDIDDEKKEAAIRILSKLDDDVVSKWVDEASVKSGKVTSTHYKDLSGLLSFDDFKELYESIGYDFNEMSTWMDWWCKPPCIRRKGYSCDPDTCN